VAPFDPPSGLCSDSGLERRKQEYSSDKNPPAFCCLSCEGAAPPSNPSRPSRGDSTTGGVWTPETGGKICVTGRYSSIYAKSKVPRARGQSRKRASKEKEESGLV
jgi:hypothetical protein